MENKLNTSLAKLLHASVDDRGFVDSARCSASSRLVNSDSPILSGRNYIRFQWISANALSGCSRMRHGHQHKGRLQGRLFPHMFLEYLWWKCSSKRGIIDQSIALPTLSDQKVGVFTLHYLCAPWTVFFVQTWLQCKIIVLLLWTHKSWGVYFPRRFAWACRCHQISA